jgi:hypothetical protein
MFCFHTISVHILRIVRASACRPMLWSSLLSSSASSLPRASSCLTILVVVVVVVVVVVAVSMSRPQLTVKLRVCFEWMAPSASSCRCRGSSCKIAWVVHSRGKCLIFELVTRDHVVMNEGMNACVRMCSFSRIGGRMHAASHRIAISECPSQR